MNRIQVETSVSVAMQKAIVGMRNGGAFAAHVKQAAQRGAGKRDIPEWNAHLSKRTAVKLIEADVIAAV